MILSTFENGTEILSAAWGYQSDNFGSENNNNLIQVWFLVPYGKYIKAILKAPQGWRAVTYGFRLDALMIYA